MLRLKHSYILRYSVAVMASYTALILTQLLWKQIQPALYPFFLAAVMLSSWFGGLGPGLVSILLGAGLSEHFFMTPAESGPINWANLGRLSYFTSVAILICILNARLRFTQKRAEAHALEAQRNQALLLQNQQTLRQSEERYRLLVDGVVDYAIFILDPDGCVLSWTVGAEHIFGYQDTEVMGQPFSMLFTQEAIQQGLPKQVLETASRQGSSTENRWHIRKDKTVFWAHCVVTSLWDEAGTLQGFSKIMQDITVRKQAEEERNQLLQREQAARQEAESANRAKDEFLAILSHELRTPLTALTGWVGLLRSNTLDDVKTALALETIERNATLQMQLVEDLLDISRIIRGDLWLDSQPVNMVDVIQDAIEIVQPKLEEKQIQFEFQTDLSFNENPMQPDAPLTVSSALVLGDAERLQQIVLNLLSNALKFTPEKGTIAVYLSVINRHTSPFKALMRQGAVSLDEVAKPLSYDIQLQVKDSGIGINTDFLPHVFDRFRQADCSNTRAYKGLGLGLAIARYLVERQGGTIQANSQGEGQGAAFTVRLPLLSVSEHSPDCLPSDVVLHTFDLNGASVLVIEDEADTRIWLKNIFELHQARVIAVASVDEAVAQLAHFRPDSVVSDIAMPGKDGYDLMNHLKHYERRSGRAIPTIALTAHASLDDIEKTLAAGFWQHLAKPIKAEDLLTVMVKLLEQSSRLQGSKL